jgi:hypothetical protein
LARQTVPAVQGILGSYAKLANDMSKQIIYSGLSTAAFVGVFSRDDLAAICNKLAIDPASELAYEVAAAGMIARPAGGSLPDARDSQLALLRELVRMLPVGRRPTYAELKLVSSFLVWWFFCFQVAIMLFVSDELAAELAIRQLVAVFSVVPAGVITTALRRLE